MAIFITDIEHSTYLRQQIDDCGETSKGFNSLHNNDSGSDIVDSDYPPLGQSRYEVVKHKVYRKSKRGSKYVQTTSGIFSI